jgi:hypothetical protein
MGITELLASYVEEPLWRISFVTSIALVTDSEAWRPYAVIAGHMWSCGRDLLRSCCWAREISPAQEWGLLLLGCWPKADSAGVTWNAGAFAIR